MGCYFASFYSSPSGFFYSSRGLFTALWKNIFFSRGIRNCCIFVSESPKHFTEFFPGSQIFTPILTTKVCPPSPVEALSTRHTTGQNQNGFESVCPPPPCARESLVTSHSPLFQVPALRRLPPNLSHFLPVRLFVPEQRVFLSM